MTDKALSALLVQPGQLPDVLPSTLGEIEPRLHPGEPSLGHSEPVTLFLTVDVEDSYFGRPILMTGDGIGREFGVFGILDELDSLNLKATFFVNVYEKDRQPAGVVEGVVREIAERGHEVGLHTHPSPTLQFYRWPLFRLTRVEQVKVLRWGADLIADWTGEFPTSFRAGGYALNDDTFEALGEVGIAIDSSCFFPSSNNRNTRHTVNANTDQSGLNEMPITTVLRASSDRKLEHRKLDLDWLSVEHLVSALENLIHHRASYAVFMMHSFSFIEKQTRMPDEKASSRARFVSEVHGSRYVEVYGPKHMMREAFANFLERIVSEPLLQVRTLRDALYDLRHVPCESKDVVPIVSQAVGGS